MRFAFPLISFLILSAVFVASPPMRTTAQSPPNEQNLTYTVYPTKMVRIDASLHLSVPPLPENVTGLPGMNLQIETTQGASQVSLNAQISLRLASSQVHDLPFPLNSTDSFSLSGTYLYRGDNGTISLQFLPGTGIIFSGLTLAYASNSTDSILTGAVTMPFNSSLIGNPLENRTAFDSYYTSILGNTTHLDYLRGELYNETHGNLQLISLNFTPPTYVDDTSVQLSCRIVLAGGLLKTLLMMLMFSGISPSLLDQIAGMTRGAIYNMTYARSSGMVIVQAVSVLDSDLDVGINMLKVLMMNASIPNPPIPEDWLFLNSTLMQIGRLSLQETTSPNETQIGLYGLLVEPTTLTVPGGFLIPDIFARYYPGPVNITLRGGSVGTRYVTLSIPPSVTPPNSSNSSMAVWLNSNNLTSLAAVRFIVTSELTVFPPSLLLLSGLLISSVILLRRRRRTR